MTKKISDVTQIVTTRSGDIGIKPSESCYLVMIYGEYLGRRFEIDWEPIIIGRSRDCHIQLTDESVSRNHCRIFRNEENILLKDLGSTNGTFVNSRTTPEAVLQDGDRITIGRSIFKFLSGDNIEHAYHEEIYRLMTTDSLTGAFNKAFFIKEVSSELYRFHRYKRPLAMAMLDIDFFKKINDKYGHIAGDRVLAQLGPLIRSTVRMEDTFSRFGGEEFALLMPEMDMKGAVDVSGRIRKKIEQFKFKFEKLHIPVTISIGVAQATQEMTKPDEFIQSADERLYKAKYSGRNCVVPNTCDY